MGIFSPFVTNTADSQVATENLDNDVTSTDNVITDDNVATEGFDPTASVDVTPPAGDPPVDPAPEVVPPVDEPVAPPTDDVVLPEPTTDSPADTVAVENLDVNTAEVTNTAAVVDATTMVRSVSSHAYALLASAPLAATFQRRSESLRQSVRDARLVQGLSQAATENNFSAPLVAAMQAIPGFTQLVKNMPPADKFNIVPQHPTNAISTVGMESFVDAGLSASEAMQTMAAGVVGAYADILENLGGTVAQMRAQIQENDQALAQSDVSEDVLATLPVLTISDAAFTQVLGKNEMYLKTVVQPFNADSLQANPEQVLDEVRGLQIVVADVGPVLGLALDEFGLKATDRDAQFTATAGTFADKDLNGGSVSLMTARANALLDALETVAGNKDALVAAANQAIAETPQLLETTDVTYGALDHVTLLNANVTLATSLINESVSAVALVLSATDSILNVEVGQAVD